jgi:hypothetical protein
MGNRHAPDGVDTSVDPIEPADGHSVLNRAPAKAEPKELPECNDSVLAIGEFGDPKVTWTI